MFEAPLATDNPEEIDPNRYDRGGKLLREVLAGIPGHLNPGGRIFLMSRPDLAPYLPRRDLQWKVLRRFEAKSSVAIHEIRCETGNAPEN